MMLKERDSGLFRSLFHDGQVSETWHRHHRKDRRIVENRIKDRPDRKIRWILIFAAFAVGIYIFTQLTGRTGMQNRYDAQYLGMFDTVTSIVAYSKDQHTFNSIAEEFHQKLERYNRLYDIYNDYDGINNIKTINDNAGIQPVQVDKDIIDMLEEAVELYELTDGRINVAMGSVLSIWHDHREEGRETPDKASLPQMEELKKAAEHTDIYSMEIDREHSTVYLKDPAMSLDVGAIAKGYATEMVCRKLKEDGLTSALINVGGNVRAIGTKPDGTGWTVGIQNPDIESDKKYLMTLDVKDMSLVTSGSYQRYYEVDGVRYHHIIHPKLLMPWNKYTSVSILCRDSGWADALATAVFNMEWEEGSTLIESLDGVEAMWIEPDGTEHYSSGFQKYVDEK